MWIRPANIPAALMIALAAAGLGGAADSAFWAAPLIVAALLHGVWGLGLPGKPRLFFMLLLAVPFALSLREVPRNQFVSPVLILATFGLYLQAVGLYHLMTSRQGGNVHQAMSCAVVGVALAGTAERHAWLLPLFAAFMVLLLWHVRGSLAARGAPRGHWSRNLRITAAAALVVALAGAMHWAAGEAIPRLNAWAAQRMLQFPRGNTLGGYTRQSRLGSVASLWDQRFLDQVVIRGWGSQPPGYLRGSVLDRYEFGIWSSQRNDYVQIAARESDAGRSVFDIVGGDPGPLLATVYPNPEFAQTFFLPLNGHRFSAYCGNALQGDAWTFRPPNDEANGGYGIYRPTARMPEPEPRHLAVPGDLRPDLHRIALAVVRPDDPPAVQIGKLETWFRDHFTYQLGVAWRGSRDPVLEFLEEARSGHCEYFATAGVLLLRTLGVPARYVTGFVVEEQGVGRRQWLGRRKDAHAWVEAYLPQTGWTTVEFTPPQARPQTPPPSRRDAWSEYFRSQWHRFRNILGYGGILAVLALAWDGTLAFMAWVPWWLWTAIVVVAGAWIFRQPLIQLLTPRRREALSPRATAFQARLLTAERLLARHGLHRRPSMPVGDFLLQVQDAPVPEPDRGQALAILRDYQAQRFRRPEPQA